MEARAFSDCRCLPSSRRQAPARPTAQPSAAAGARTTCLDPGVNTCRPARIYLFSVASGRAACHAGTANASFVAMAACTAARARFTIADSALSIRDPQIVTLCMASRASCRSQRSGRVPNAHPDLPPASFSPLAARVAAPWRSLIRVFDRISRRSYFMPRDSKRRAAGKINSGAADHVKRAAARRAAEANDEMMAAEARASSISLAHPPLLPRPPSLPTTHLPLMLPS